uniref:Uncharacterized protein n=1 Tax=Candidatus Kentrum sp. MB TaxID=2138164 RepID=A0A451BDR0_9GAMM|nr:MAG: hypothetical protein BECKMB1821I_GA0114274_105820 [Candidatus Kentron sp. MB]VFK76416.1 MAG: hypothetical protein BECKMB1821H_GA0114242_105520 [Candidatus Kentron sp. MB]
MKVQRIKDKLCEERATIYPYSFEALNAGIYNAERRYLLPALVGIQCLSLPHRSPNTIVILRIE